MMEIRIDGKDLRVDDSGQVDGLARVDPARVDEKLQLLQREWRILTFCAETIFIEFLMLS